MVRILHSGKQGNMRESGFKQEGLAQIWRYYSIERCGTWGVIAMGEIDVIPC